MNKLEKVGDGAIDDYVTLLTDLDLALAGEPPREAEGDGPAVTASRHEWRRRRRPRRRRHPGGRQR